MIPFSGMITNDGTVSFTHTDGRIYTILRSHVGYTEAVKILNKLADTPDDEDLRLQLFEMTQPKRIIAHSSNGRILVDGNSVTFDGKQVEPVIAKRLIWMIEQGFNAEPLFKFLTNLSENPSYRAVQSLYSFMDASKMAITNDGMVLAYKRIRDDYKDIYTGTFDNSVGQQPTMPRNEVDDNPQVVCSSGLHVCSIAYLPQFGARMEGNRVVICEIHPRDVVSVPVDYGHAKMRVCTYRVIGEIEDASDILGRSAVITPTEKGWVDTKDSIIEIDDQWVKPKPTPLNLEEFMAKTKNDFESAYFAHYNETIDVNAMRDVPIEESTVAGLLELIDVNRNNEATVGELYDSYVRKMLAAR